MPDSSITMVLGVMLTYWDRGNRVVPDTELVLLNRRMQSYYNLNWRLGIEESSLRRPEILNLSIKPNPIKDWAMINFSLKEHNYVTLELYNPLGQVVKNILKGNRLSGEYNIKIDTEGLASGTYFLVLKVGGEITSRRLIIIK